MSEDGAEDGELALADEPAEHADTSEVREFAELLQQLLASRRPPPGPIVEPWSFGVGDLLAEHPQVPKRVGGLVKRLSRFGGVAFSPAEITFDGEDVPRDPHAHHRDRREPAGPARPRPAGAG